MSECSEAYVEEQQTTGGGGRGCRGGAGRQAVGQVRLLGGGGRVGVRLRSRWPSWGPWGKGSRSFGKVSREARRLVNYPPGDDDLNTTAREKVEGTG